MGSLGPTTKGLGIRYLNTLTFQIPTNPTAWPGTQILGNAFAGAVNFLRRALLRWSPIHLPRPPHRTRRAHGLWVQLPRVCLSLQYNYLGIGVVTWSTFSTTGTWSHLSYFTQQVCMFQKQLRVFSIEVLLLFRYGKASSQESAATGKTALDSCPQEAGAQCVWFWQNAAQPALLPSRRALCPAFPGLQVCQGGCGANSWPP